MKILFRQHKDYQEEIEAAAKYFDIAYHRTDCKKELVIPRYSALPYYNELEYDLERLKCNSIQSYKQHKWIADFEWYRELKKYTFDTWTFSDIMHAPENIRYVVKGKTNSKKWRWNTEMFAPNRAEAIKIGSSLYSDGLIGSQGILFRRYEPLVKLEEGINGLPFSNEFRFFYLGEALIGSGFYWAVAEEEVIPKDVPRGAQELADEVAKIASQHTHFFVLDIAEREGGGWVLVEMNCGTMSGLSCIEADAFYKRLGNIISVYSGDIF